MNLLALLLWIFAAIAFLVASVPPRTAIRVNLVALGLLLLTVGAIVQDLTRHHPIHF